MKKLVAILPLFTLAMGWTACASEEEMDKAVALLGQWNVTEAYRNGRPTESLAGLYLVFEAEGIFKTNLNGTPEEGQYELEENTISTTNVALPLNYEIVEMGDSTLILQSSFQIYQFYFKFKRAAQENSPLSS